MFKHAEDKFFGGYLILKNAIFIERKTAFQKLKTS